MFTLALLAMFAPVGFPSTLSCHVAVKPTICDMLLSHEKLGTDTLLPTPSESRQYSLGSPMHTCKSMPLVRHGLTPLVLLLVWHSK